MCLVVGEVDSQVVGIVVPGRGVTCLMPPSPWGVCFSCMMM